MNNFRTCNTSIFFLQPWNFDIDKFVINKHLLLSVISCKFFCKTQARSTMSHVFIYKYKICRWLIYMQGLLAWNLENLILVNWQIKFLSEMTASVTSCTNHKESIWLVISTSLQDYSYEIMRYWSEYYVDGKSSQDILTFYNTS